MLASAVVLDMLARTAPIWHGHSPLLLRPLVLFVFFHGDTLAQQRSFPPSLIFSGYEPLLPSLLAAIESTDWCCIDRCRQVFAREWEKATWTLGRVRVIDASGTTSLNFRMRKTQSCALLFLLLFAQRIVSHS